VYCVELLVSSKIRRVLILDFVFVCWRLCGMGCGDMKRVYEFDVVIVEDESGGYVAFVPSLPSCHTQGESIDEALENIKEAIELYLETLSDEEKEEFTSQRVVDIQRVKAIA